MTDVWRTKCWRHKTFCWMTIGWRQNANATRNWTESQLQNVEYYCHKKMEHTDISATLYKDENMSQMQPFFLFFCSGQARNHSIFHFLSCRPIITSCMSCIDCLSLMFWCLMFCPFDKLLPIRSNFQIKYHLQKEHDYQIIQTNK